MPLKPLNNQWILIPSFGSSIPSRLGQAFRRTWLLQLFDTGTMHCWKNGAIHQVLSARRRTECITTLAPMTPFLSRCRS
jgi:hypothetical protein